MNFDKSRKIASCVFLVAVVLYIIYWDYLPPSTPLKKLKSKSDLSISNINEVIYEFYDCSFTGDCLFQIIVKLSKEETKRLVRECEEKNYSKNMHCFAKDEFFYQYINKTDTLFFRETNEISNDNHGFTTRLLLNESQNLLILDQDIY